MEQTLPSLSAATIESEPCIKSLMFSSPPSSLLIMILTSLIFSGEPILSQMASADPFERRLEKSRSKFSFKIDKPEGFECKKAETKKLKREIEASRKNSVAFVM